MQNADSNIGVPSKSKVNAQAQQAQELRQTLSESDRRLVDFLLEMDNEPVKSSKPSV